MGFTPDIFWQMSFEELFLAIDVFAEFHSGGKPPPLTNYELNELMELYPD